MSKKIIYESPYVTTDTVIFTIQDGVLKVLLIKRINSPFKDTPALPGVFLLKDESTREAALRALKTKAGLKMGFLEQLYTFDSRHRDPRGHTISITYFAFVREDELKIAPIKSLQSPEFYPIKKLPRLAFDHKEIIELALMRLQAKLEYTNVVYSLLPKYFAFSELQKAYEIIFGRKIDKRNFRKKFLSLGLIRPTRQILRGTRSRPAKLYEFKSRKPSALKKFF
ncbi:MAG: NUDIX domain-containing protein [bacterium]|nr:NUDIX domain-containing protein [bacterium]